jgi:hypothetical protein
MMDPSLQSRTGPEQMKQAAGDVSEAASRAISELLPTRLSEDRRLILDLLDW